MKIRRLEKDKVMRESYSKRLNILVHGLKELGNDKTKEQAKALQYLTILLAKRQRLLWILSRSSIFTAYLNIPFAKQVKLSLDLYYCKTSNKIRKKIIYSKPIINLSNITMKENHVFSLRTTCQNYFTTKKSN